jgi:hypothetical protein
MSKQHKAIINPKFSTNETSIEQGGKTKGQVPTMENPPPPPPKPSKK